MPQRKRSWSTRAAWFFLSLALVLVYGRLLVEGIPNGHDAGAHCLWAEAMAGGWAEGLIYPRWVSAAQEGAGNPGLLYYPPLVSLLSAPWVLLGFTAREAVALTALLGLGVGAWGASQIFDDEDQGRLAAALWLLSPYLVLDVYIRTALAETLGLCVFMVVLAAIKRCARRGSWSDIRLLALATAAMCLAHPLSAAIAAPLSAIWALHHVSRKTIGSLAAGVLLGLLLISGYLVPLALERKLVEYQVLFKESEAIRSFHYVQWPLDRGDGLTRRFQRIFLVSLGGFALALGGLLLTPMRAALRRRTALLGLLGAVFLALCRPETEWFYRHLPWVAAAQFPWRHFGPATVCLCLVLPPVLWPARPSLVHRALTGLVLALFFGFAMNFMGKGHWEEIPLIPERAREHMLAREYVPRCEEAPVGFPEPRGVRVVGEGVALREVSEGHGRWELVLATEPGVERARVLVEIRERSCRGWVMRVDGRERRLEAGLPARRYWVACVVSFDEPGEKRLVLVYQGPPSTRWGALGSLLTLLGLIALSWRFNTVLK